MLANSGGTGAEAVGPEASDAQGCGLDDGCIRAPGAGKRVIEDVSQFARLLYAVLSSGGSLSRNCALGADRDVRSPNRAIHRGSGDREELLELADGVLAAVVEVDEVGFLA